MNTYTWVTHLYEQFETGNARHTAALMHPNIDWRQYAPVAAFGTQHRHGPTDVMALFERIRERVTIHRFKTHAFYCDGDTAIVLGDEQYTVKSTGKSATTRWLHRCRFEEGLLVEFEEFSDTAAIANAFQLNLTQEIAS